MRPYDFAVCADGDKSGMRRALHVIAFNGNDAEQTEALALLANVRDALEEIAEALTDRQPAVIETVGPMTFDPTTGTIERMGDG